MKIKLLLFLIVFSFVFSGLKAQVDVGDSLALVDLYNATDGPNWNFNYNWLTEKPVGQWYGIKVRNHRIIYVVLGDNNLTGSLPSSLGNLDSLLALKAAGNAITGTFPSTLLNLTALRHIDLGFNQISGDLPDSIGKLTRIVELNVENNLLEGMIPPSIGNCKDLEYLMLNNNQLSGHMPVTLCRLKKLKFLELEYNQLNGQLPDQFDTGSALYEFDVTSNQLTGTIPLSLSNLTELVYLDLPSNQLRGNIPSELSRLTKLNRLSLAKNQLTGSIPSSFKSFTHLGNLNVSNNYLMENTSIPLDGNQYFFTCNLEKNRFNFNLPEYIVQEDKFTTYTPQANISIQQYQHKLAVTAGGTLSNNTYTWFQVGKGKGNVVVGDSTFAPTESGSYYCSITNKIATQLTLHTDTVTYITNALVKNKMNISLSPNPARGMLSIYGLDEKSDAKITIADISGNVWMSVMSRKQSSLQVDVSRLKAGNYLLSVNDGQEVKTVEFVKE